MEEVTVTASVTKPVTASVTTRRTRTPHGTPRRPEIVFDVIRGRDLEKRTLDDIGHELDMTRAGVRYLYYKWHGWFYQNYEW
jgi:hypothetical protein